MQPAPCHYFFILHSNRRFLAGAFGAGSDLVFACLVFVLSLAHLLLDFFDHQVDRSVKVAFAILGEQIRPAHGQAHRAGKLAFGHPRVVVLKSNARMHHARIEAIQFINLGEHVFLNGVRQRYVVRGKDQLHAHNMESPLAIFNRQFAAAN